MPSRPDMRWPANNNQIVTAISYASRCPTCYAAPYEPCTFVSTRSLRFGEPRDNYEATHLDRWRIGYKAIQAWREHQYPNVTVVS